MREPLPLDAAAFRASLNESLFEVILEKASAEKVSESLIDLISLAWSTNSELCRTLEKESA